MTLLQTKKAIQIPYKKESKKAKYFQCTFLKLRLTFALKVDGRRETTILLLNKLALFKRGSNGSLGAGTQPPKAMRVRLQNPQLLGKFFDFSQKNIYFIVIRIKFARFQSHLKKLKG